MLTRISFRRHLPLFFLILILWSSQSMAQTAVKMKLTIYDDGRSCPANCDAHVVFHRLNNGTPNAHLPTSASPHFEKCIPGNECEICFDADPDSCMLVMYRGNGPHQNTFDFTPAFYEGNCPRPNIPEALAEQCRALTEQAKSLENRINCIHDANHPKCADLIAAAKQRKEMDEPLYNTCLEQGEEKFNGDRLESEQRSENCAYEKHGTGGPNSKGKRWRKLLPAVCRENTFVGRDGLDCCSGSTFRDGPLGIECKGFYPRP